MVGQAENNNVPTRNAPNSDQEPQRSRGPDDRPTPPHPDEMNRKTAPGRDSAAPSSPGSRRESHHSDGITDQKSLQRTSATKSANRRPEQVQQIRLGTLPWTYSITSSARASSVGGTSRPSVLAVLRLITSSYFTGACTGRSAGLS